MLRLLLLCCWPHIELFGLGRGGAKRFIKFLASTSSRCESFALLVPIKELRMGSRRSRGNTATGDIPGTRHDPRINEIIYGIMRNKFF